MVRDLAIGALVLVLTSGAALALPIIQQSGNYFAWEAEGTAATRAAGTSAWSEVPYTGASGVGAIQATGNHNLDSSADIFNSYELQVTDASQATSGSYYLFLRRAKPFAGDSVWRPNALNVDPTGGSFTLLNDSPGNVSQLSWFSTLATYSFAGSDNGDVLTFTIKPREAGYVIDRIVLSQNAGLSHAQLDALSNSTVVVPEPATLALAGLGLLMVAGRRRD